MPDVVPVSPRPTPPSTSPVPAPVPSAAQQQAQALTAIEDAHNVLAASGPSFSVEAARAAATRLRELANHVPEGMASTLRRDAAELERAASAHELAKLSAQRPSSQAAAGTRATPRDPNAPRLLDALAGVHVAPGRDTAAVTGRMVRDLGPDGLVGLAAQVSHAEVVAAMQRHGASATEAHAIAQRLGTNAAEGLHTALYDAVLAGLQERAREVRAANAPGERAATTQAVLTGRLDISRHMAAVGQQAAAAELAALATRYRDATPAQRPELQRQAEVLVDGALRGMARVLDAHIAFMPQHLRNDQTMDLPRSFPVVFLQVAQDAGLPPRAASALGSSGAAAGASLLERAWAARAEEARGARRTVEFSRATLVAIGDLVVALDPVPDAPGPREVFRQTLRAADAAVEARDRSLLVAGFLVQHPLRP